MTKAEDETHHDLTARGFCAAWLQMSGRKPPANAVYQWCIRTRDLAGAADAPLPANFDVYSTGTDCA